MRVRSVRTAGGPGIAAVDEFDAGAFERPANRRHVVFDEDMHAGLEPLQRRDPDIRSVFRSFEQGQVK
jgi:hypothetical protein